MKIHRDGNIGYNVSFQNREGNDVLAFVTKHIDGPWHVSAALRDVHDGSFTCVVWTSECPTLEGCFDDLFVLETSKSFIWETI